MEETARSRTYYDTHYEVTLVCPNCSSFGLISVNLNGDATVGGDGRVKQDSEQ